MSGDGESRPRPRGIRLGTNEPLRVVSPCVTLIADGFAGGSERMSAAAVQLRTLEALRAASLWVHLRDHGVSAEAFAEAAALFVGRLRQVRNDAVLTINTHLDVAESLGARLHVGVRGPSVEEARARLGPHSLVSASVHSVREAREAVEQGAHAVLFSPIFPTSSKPGHEGAGLAALRVCCEAVPDTSVVALGGITPERVRLCLDAGAQSVAVLSGILHADRPAEAALRYASSLRRP